MKCHLARDHVTIYRLYKTIRYLPMIHNNAHCIAQCHRWTLTFCEKSEKQMEHSTFFRVARFIGFDANGFWTCAISKNLSRFSSVSRSSNSCLSHFVWLNRIRVVVVVAGIYVCIGVNERQSLISSISYDISRYSVVLHACVYVLQYTCCCLKAKKKRAY